MQASKSSNYEICIYLTSSYALVILLESAINLESCKKRLNTS